MGSLHRASSTGHRDLRPREEESTRQRQGRRETARDNEGNKFSAEIPPREVSVRAYVRGFIISVAAVAELTIPELWNGGGLYMADTAREYVREIVGGSLSAFVGFPVARRGGREREREKIGDGNNNDNYDNAASRR